MARRKPNLVKTVMRMITPANVESAIATAADILNFVLPLMENAKPGVEIPSIVKGIDINHSSWTIDEVRELVEPCGIKVFGKPVHEDQIKKDYMKYVDYPEGRIVYMSYHLDEVSQDRVIIAEYVTREIIDISKKMVEDKVAALRAAEESKRLAALDADAKKRAAAQAAEEKKKAKEEEKKAQAEAKKNQAGERKVRKTAEHESRPKFKLPEIKFPIMSKREKQKELVELETLSEDTESDSAN